MKSEKDPLFTEAMRRYKASVEATQENRVDMIDDQRFASGDQWPDDVKTLRVGRPMQTINRLPSFVDQRHYISTRTIIPSLRIFKSTFSAISSNVIGKTQCFVWINGDPII